LKVYLEGTLLASATDATLTAPGGVGIIASIGPGAAYTNFSAYQLLPAPNTFSDNFTRTNATTLSDPWSVDQGGYTLSGNQAVAAALQSEATLYGAQLTNVDESVNIATQGTSAGLLARWNSATQTGYEVLLTGTTLNVYSVQNGMLGMPIATMTTSGSTGTLRFTVTGTTLQVYFNGTALFSGSGFIDSSISGPGTVGLISGGSSAFGTYTVSGS
jgi:hypothetical protein